MSSTQSRPSVRWTCKPVLSWVSSNTPRDRRLTRTRRAAEGLVTRVCGDATPRSYIIMSILSLSAPHYVRLRALSDMIERVVRYWSHEP